MRYMRNGEKKQRQQTVAKTQHEAIKKFERDTHRMFSSFPWDMSYKQLNFTRAFVFHIIVNKVQKTPRIGSRSQCAIVFPQ